MEFKEIVKTIGSYINQKGNYISDNLVSFPNLFIKQEDNKYIANVGVKRTIQGIEITSTDADSFITDVLTTYYKYAEGSYNMNGLSFVISKALEQGESAVFNIRVTDCYFYKVIVNEKGIDIKPLIEKVEKVEEPLDIFGETEIVVLPNHKQDNIYNCS